MLTILSLKNCKNLKIFPNITKLESLEHLNLSGCSKIQNLVGSHPLRLSLFHLSSLLRKFHGPVSLVLPSLSTFDSLRILNVSHCNLTGASVSSLESLCSLEELDMSCKKLQILPELPSSILNLDAQHCISLQALPKLSTMGNGGTAVFDFKNCSKVVENQTIGVAATVTASMVLQKLKGLATCVVITLENATSRSTYSEISCSVKNLHGDLIGDVSLMATDDPNIESDQIWMWYRKSDPRWKKADDEIMVSFICVGINCKDLSH
ncbi:hypothetical protein L1987_54985 [Smallanthus sonchifolius]|uniref:Uncharacterized protein n=1 Tax=Smallanthus sonchifolius TaxID=185202 RepID=A0ACB9E8K5_9ASTR|nr:hypothetical protein L1987_54985 [Smallanthus sonchifolius]